MTAAAGIKRTFDATAALAGLAITAPLLLVVALLVKLDSPGPVFFRQERIGRRFRPFTIFKFRTMHHALDGPPITAHADQRITRVGRLLRRTKFDELPQLFNVLRGEMSLVGPRPEVRKFVEMFRDDYAQILSVRPGITDLASLKYRDEPAVLAQFDNPEEAYVTRILPDKIGLAKECAARGSLWFDILIILRTLRSLLA